MSIFESGAVFSSGRASLEYLSPAVSLMSCTFLGGVVSRMICYDFEACFSDTLQV